MNSYVRVTSFYDHGQEISYDEISTCPQVTKRKIKNLVPLHWPRREGNKESYILDFSSSLHWINCELWMQQSGLSGTVHCHVHCRVTCSIPINTYINTVNFFEIVAIHRRQDRFQETENLPPFHATWFKYVQAYQCAVSPNIFLINGLISMRRLHADILLLRRYWYQIQHSAAFGRSLVKISPLVKKILKVTGVDINKTMTIYTCRRWVNRRTASRLLESSANFTNPMLFYVNPCSYIDSLIS
jgi:hypothetical protein